MAEDYTTPPEMQESYDRENIGDEGDLAVEEAIKTTEHGTRERADALLDAAELKKRLNKSIDGRGSKAFAAELGIGIIADIVLPSPDPLSRGLNFGIGYGTNALAQMWRRGEFNYDKGEALAAGTYQAIPFGTVAKGWKGIGRAAIKGGTGAVVGEQVRVGIDERRALTPGEAGTAFATGGVLGGTFKGTIEGGGALKNKIVDIIDNPYKYAPEGSLAEMMYQTGGGIVKPPKSGDGSSPIRDFEAFEPWMTTLRKQGPYNFLGKRKASAQMVTDPTGKKGYRVTPEVEQAFLDEGVKQTAVRAEAFGYDLGNMETHHTALLRQLFESLNGLDDDFIDLGARFYERELGFKIGWDIEDALSIPKIWHPRLHALINNRIASRPNAWDLKGIERKFNLAPDWQRTLEYDDREPIFREIINAIKQSIKDTETLYKGLNSRTLKSGKLSKKDYINLAFDLAELDDRLRGLKSPNWSQSKAIETASEIINEILTNVDRVDLTLPSFEKLNPNQTKAVAKVLLQENGAKALYEAIISGQSADTIFRANNIIFTENNRIWKRILKKLDPDDLFKSGVSIEDVDTHIRAGWADPTKAKSSLKPPLRSKPSPNMTPEEVQARKEAGWYTKE